MTGVLTFSWGGNAASPDAYRVHPTGTVTFSNANPRPTSAPDVGGSLKVAAFNVLNYFNGDGMGGGFPTSRGAESLFEFNRQRDKIIAALLEINADVVGLMEIENDAPPNSAVEDLVDGLNDNSAPGTYSFIDTGVIGTDEIKVALIYKPGSVTPVGSFEILDSTFDPAYIDTLNRPMLVQTFEDGGGERFTVAATQTRATNRAIAT
jgi:predicted extracellular nuclease